MKSEMVLQGRSVTPEDITFIEELLTENPDWSRRKLSREVCGYWNWHTATGQMKDMACRSLLRKLDRLGFIKLPAARRAPSNRMRLREWAHVDHPPIPQGIVLRDLFPIQIVVVAPRTPEAKLFEYFLSTRHYLGYRGTVGENMPYLILDGHDRPLGCMLFGSAAWKTAPRDDFIGWNPEQRKRHMHLITNNMRFLLLPRVPNLASHVLGRMVRRLSDDWEEKYGHPIHLIETFVEADRFTGACYRAANWVYVGQTQGRSRNDSAHRMKVPIKHIYCYPLTSHFRQELTRGS